MHRLDRQFHRDISNKASGFTYYDAQEKGPDELHPDALLEKLLLVPPVPNAEKMRSGFGSPHVGQTIPSAELPMV